MTEEVRPTMEEKNQRILHLMDTYGMTAEEVLKWDFSFLTNDMEVITGSLKLLIEMLGEGGQYDEFKGEVCREILKNRVEDLERITERLTVQ